ncbi:MAG: heavy-metal-associated domain-containing protein [Deltaproteobacteria bacterium]|nr:heavy-metal-associated domain-containing protein [Deltaproteobacteria bacterium]
MKHLLIIIVLMLAMIPVHTIAAEQKVELEITGMTCSLCTVAVKKSLSKIDGITDIKVSYKDEKAWFVADDSITDEVLIKAIKKAGGYKVQSIHRE